MQKIKYIFDTIIERLGYVRCNTCGKFTQPSIIFGNVCSSDCLCEDMDLNNEVGE